MLDTETKRRIDSCRDILVGKVPDPKSQVEQITIALIYKFMDDMDTEAEELGGERTFFAAEFAKYGWARLMAPGVGGFDMLNLYGEAVARMNENPGVPALFRDIFKNAYLPYRDPETLRAFLKEINFFKYDHSERLGDAFEYLLSVLGSQGDAGQFRTPRHLIDFIVEVVDPQKNEVVLDPACGTAGFLIAAYKHIQAANRDTPLLPDERARLAANFVGYDISPDMVRLSLVNLYLHGFALPRIEEYDTLTSDTKWNEYADVILANPPFMSPKGGIKPHKRFGVQSNRSEVLFVDYIAEHLTAKGRAGVIVPEGVIFSGGTAYKALRKMLVENQLLAVVSLPAGVFQPYSGVKTSVLILDKARAKASDAVLFVKIVSDGYGLGAQRRAVATNDLPGAAAALRAWRDSRDTGDRFDAGAWQGVSVVEKAALAAGGEYNLSADRYVVAAAVTSDFSMVRLGDVCELVGGSTPSKEKAYYWTGGSVKWISSKHIDGRGKITGYELITEEAVKETSTRIAPKDSVILISRVSVGKIAYADDDYAINQDLTAVIPKETKVINPRYLFLASLRLAKLIEQNAQGIGVKGVTRNYLSDLEIPLPPLDVQQAIVAEVASYQAVIDGARQVVENYKPRIDISDLIERGIDVPSLPFSDVCTLEYGTSLPTGKRAEGKYPVVGSNGITGYHNQYLVKGATIVVGRKGSAGEVTLIEEDCFPIDTTYFIKPQTENVDIRYLYFVLKTLDLPSLKGGAGIPGLNRNDVYLRHKIPLPPLETQRALVAEIEAEQALVNANRELITRFAAKIAATIARVWNAPPAAPVPPA